MLACVCVCVFKYGEAFEKGDTQKDSSERQAGNERGIQPALIDGDDKRLVERRGIDET